MKLDGWKLISVSLAVISYLYLYNGHHCCCCCCCCYYYVLGRFKNGKVIISKQPEFKRMKVQQQVLEIREVCELDAGNYTVVMRNPAAALEARLSFTLIVNGNQQPCLLL